MASVIAATPQPIRMARSGMRADLSHPINRGCVGWWPLWDGAGTEAVDLIGGNDGTATAVEWGANAIGGFAAFNGFGSVISTGKSLIGGTAGKSISVWFSTTNSLGSGDNNLFGQGQNTAGGEYYCSIESGVVWLRCNANTASAGTGYNDGNCHHLVISNPANASTSDVLVYVDGVLLATTTSGSATLDTGSADLFTIGARRTSNNAFEGNIQDFRIFNRVITASEIHQLYTQPWAGLEPLSPYTYYSTGAAPPSGGYSPIFYNHFRNMGFM